MVNYLAVFASSAASMALCSLWYSNFLFGRIWRKTAGVPSVKRRLVLGFVGGYLAQLVVAYVLIHFIRAFQAIDLFDALQLAFWVWLGFTAVTSLQLVLWEGKPVSYWAVHAGYALMSLLLMSLIMVLWGDFGFIEIS